MGRRKKKRGDMDWLLGEQEEAPQIPTWVNAVFEGIAALVLFGVMIVVCRQIRDIFCKFRRSYDENGDRIEELTETEESQYFIHRKHRYADGIKKRSESAEKRCRADTNLRQNLRVMPDCRMRNYMLCMRLQDMQRRSINIKFDCPLAYFRVLYNQETST